MHSGLTTPLVITATLVLASLAPTIPPTDQSAAVSLLARVCAAAAISSGTLLLTSAFAALRKYLPDAVDEGGGYARRKSHRMSAWDVVERAVSVWACYFAMMELGGVRAAALVITCLAAGLGGAGVQGLSRRKAITGAIAVAAAWDVYRGAASGAGVFGVLMAYGALVSAMVGMRSPWIPTLGQANKVPFAAACVLAIVAASGWVLGLNAGISRERLGLQALACVVGAVGMIVGEGINGVAMCGAGVFAAIAGGWVLGLIDTYDVYTDSGLGALALAGGCFFIP